MPGMEELSTLVNRLESVALRLEGAAGKGGDQPADNSSLTASVAAFDAVLAGSFVKFMNTSKVIGGDVEKIASMAQQALNAERNFIITASKSKKPTDQKELMSLLSPISNKLQEITEFREKNRRSEYFNHLSAISESIAALGWVSVSPAPAPFVKEMNDAGQFYTNRVLKDWKAKSETHVEWTKTWIQTLAELQAYVKEYHTTGLAWNPKGGAASSVSAGGAPPPPPPGAPLPPPPPPPGALDAGSANSGTNARAELLSALSRGTDITKGLKKVSDDQKTHKNPTLRASSTVPHKEKPAVPPKYGAAATAATIGAAAGSKPSRLELDGKKWLVEYFKGNPSIEISETENNHSIYVYRCEGSTIIVKGKVNNIIMDSCKKTSVVFDTVVSGFEFINCQSVQMQVMGSVASITIDKTDGCQVYLSKDSVGAEIISAKSSEMNISFPKGEDFVEHPVPEQFKTVIKGGKLVTVATESV